jgi:hypothetical protein
MNDHYNEEKHGWQWWQHQQVQDKSWYFNVDVFLRYMFFIL